MRLAKYLFLPILFVLLSLNIPIFAQQSGSVTRLITTAGEEFNDHMGFMSMSDDGRYIAFASWSNNIVANDFNDTGDIFVYDRQTNTYSRVSVSSLGEEADGGSDEVAISADGRYIAFTSYASNLVAGDTNGLEDIFLHDRQTAQTTRILLDYNGNEVTEGFFYMGIDMSADGRYISFESDATMIVANDTNGVKDMFVYDRQTATNIRISVDSSGNQANDHSTNGYISSNGRYVIFTSTATNLVAGDTNDIADVFRYDLQTGTIIRVSLVNGGGQAFYTGGGSSVQTGYNLSSNGRFVIFMSNVNTLVTGDTNGDIWDVFVHDTQTLTTKRVSVSTGGAQANDISGAGFVSDDGRYVLYESFSTNLVAGDTNNSFDVFMRDTQLNTTVRLSLTPTGGQINGSSGLGGVSADMRYLVTVSDATDIITPDTNNEKDIFIYDRLQLGTPTLTAPANGANTTNPNVAFSWNTVAGATQYQIQIATSNAFTTIIDDQTLSTNSYNYIFNTNGTYYWRVRAKDGGASGNWSSVRTLTVNLPLPPSAPILISPSHGAGFTNTDIITFNWGSVVTATQYQIQIAIDSEFTTIIHDHTLTATTYTYTFLTRGSHYWRVRAKNIAGNGPWTSGRLITINMPPAPPTLISPAYNTTVTNPNVTFSWAAIGGATQYRLEISPSNTFDYVHNRIFTTTATSYNYKLPSLRTYYWRVQATNTYGTGPWSFVNQVTLGQMPAPELIAPTDVLTTFDPTVSFSWGAVNYATDYHIQISSTDIFYNTSIIYDNTVATTSTNFVFSAVGTYYWRVRANNDNLEGMWSPARQLIVESTSAPTLLSPDHEFSSYDESFLFTWSAVNGVTDYEIQIATDYTFTHIVKQQATTATSYSHTFTLYDRYYWRVRAVNELWSRSRIVYYRFHPFANGTTSLVSDSIYQYPIIFRDTSQSLFINIDTEYAIPSGTMTDLQIDENFSSLGSVNSVSMYPNGRYSLVQVQWDKLRLYRYDRLTGEKLRISQMPDGSLITRDMHPWGMSDDGNLILFAMMLNPAVNKLDFFLYNYQTGQTTWVNNSPSPVTIYKAALSPTGQYIAAYHNVAGTDSYYLYLHNTQTQQSTQLMMPNSTSPITGYSEPIYVFNLQFYGNDRYLMFSSYEQLLPTDTNSWVDTYVYDIQTGLYEHISLGSTDAELNGDIIVQDITPDGRYVIFNVINLPNPYPSLPYKLYMHDRQQNIITRIPVDSNGLGGGTTSFTLESVSISPDGRYVAFHGTGNYYGVGTYGLYIYTRALTTPSLLSISGTANLTHEFRWTAVQDATDYEIEISTDSNFNTLLYSDTSTTPNYTQTFAETGTYYWRVRGKSSLGNGPWSATQSLIIGAGATGGIDEQQLFNSAQTHLTDGMTFALFDITPTGIITTIQFDDGAVVTTTVKLAVVNGLMQIRLEGTLGGTPAQQQILTDRVPSLVMNSFDEFMPEGYFLIEGVSMTSSTLNFDVVLPND
jgi:hypothetical protein